VNGDNKQDKRGPEGGPPRVPFNNRIALISLLVLVVIFILFFVYSDRGSSQEIPYSVFLNYLNQGLIESVKIVDQYEIQGTLQNQSGEMTFFKTTIPYPDSTLMDKLLEKNIRVTGGPKTVSPFRVFIEFLPWILGFVFIWFMFRQVQGSGNRAFNFGKSRAKQYLDTGKKITFNDVAGQEEAKYELQEVVEFLKSPQKFSKLGAKIPKGVLLVGLPGTGKTLMAKAIAGEADVSFFHMSGSDFVEMFVGVGASRVRDLFEQGRKHAPCILFIDELDAVGRVRGAGYGGGHDEREQTLNQMLVEMDGFDTKDGVIIVAATNRPDVLDPALLRPGRFDRQVVIDMPDTKEREKILKIQARRNKQKVNMEDFEDARDKAMMGIARKSKVIPKKVRRMTAYHEAGHALLHYYLKNADPLHKVTIVPHGQALGVAFSLPESDAYSRSEGWLQDRITITMGGYAAEDIIFQENTTGAQNDIDQATEIARRMVCEWGMSKSLGPVAYGQKEEPIFLGKEIARHKDYSDETAQLIDKELRSIVESGLKQAKALLIEHRDHLELLATTLVEKETLDDAQIRELLGFPARKKMEE
jgi:cell division protease FtsH